MSIGEAAPERFVCTACGACCRTLRVVLTHRDLNRLRVAEPRWQAHLGWLAPDEVDMTNEPGSWVELSEGRRLLTLSWSGGGCDYLEASGLCRIYTQRPLDCRIYPFDFSGKKPRLLPLLNACEPTWEGAADLGTAATEDAERWRELREYQSLVREWNRRAKHRRRLGYRKGTGAEFVAYLVRTLEAGLEVPDGRLPETRDPILAEEAKPTSS